MALSSLARTVLVVTVILVLVVGAGFSYLVWDFLRPKAATEEHELSYTLIVEPDADLTNVSLLVSLPVGGDDENVTATILAAARETFPANATVEVVNQSDGRYLSVEADVLPARYEQRTPVQPLTPGDGDATTTATTSSETETDVTARTGTATPRPVLRGYMVEVTIPVDDRIDTRTPVGNESTFQPRLNATETACFNEQSSATCTEFVTRVRLDYDAAQNTTVYLTTHLEGRNTWFAGGWTGNTYSQYLSTELTGPQLGWTEVSVYEEVGRGTYRWPGGDALVAEGVNVPLPT